MINKLKKNNLVVVSGLPGSGKSTLLVNRDIRSKLIKKIGLNDTAFNFGGQNEYHEILKKRNIVNLYYHYGIFFNKNFFWQAKFKNIEKLISQFSETTIVICVCKRSDLFERYKKRETSRKRYKKREIFKKGKIIFKPRFISTAIRLYSAYQDRDKVVYYYEKWIDYLSKFKVKNYIIANTSKNILYKLNYEELKNKINDVV